VQNLKTIGKKIMCAKIIEKNNIIIERNSKQHKCRNSRCHGHAHSKKTTNK